MKNIYTLNKIALLNLSIVVGVVIWSSMQSKTITPKITTNYQPTQKVQRQETGVNEQSVIQNSNITTEVDNTSESTLPDTETITPEAPLPTENATTFSKASQVSSHNTASDCWMIIDGGVYDISAYFGNHPGGDPNLLIGCGTDASAAFHSKGKSNPKDHSSAAIAILQQYRIE